MTATVNNSAHTVRYEMHNELYRQTSVGWELRDLDEKLTRTPPDCTRSRRVQDISRYHNHPYNFHVLFFLRLRDCVVNNPSTGDGMFWGPRYYTKDFHCLDALGNCRFKGY